MTRSFPAGAQALSFSAILSGLALATTLLIADSPAQAQAPPAPMPLAGGWAATTITPEIRAAASFAVPHLPRRHARLKRIDAARQQVVAGMNYEIALTLTDRTRWRVRVWSKLDRTLELTSATRLGRAPMGVLR